MRRRLEFFRRASSSLRNNSKRRGLRYESLEDRVVKDAGMAGALWDLHHHVDNPDAAGAIASLASVYDRNGQLSLNDAGAQFFHAPFHRPAFAAADAGPSNELAASPVDADPNALADLPALPLPDPDQLEQSSSDLDEAALNPQPLPPRDWDVDDLAPVDNELDWVLLNPQPLPPRVLDVNDSIFADLDLVELNPQPLPPRVSDAADADDAANLFDDGLSWIALNPQPLPPKELSIDSALSDFDWAMLNPQPLPPRIFDEANLMDDGASFAASSDLTYLQPQAQRNLHDVEIQSNLAGVNFANNLAASLAKHMSSTTSAARRNIF